VNANGQTKMSLPPWDSIVWWEIRRIPFNLVLLATGLLTIFIILTVAKSLSGQAGNEYPTPYILVPIVLYGFAANIFYTLGWITELLWSAGDTARTAPLRRRVFRLGLIGSTALTLLPAGLAGLIWLAAHIHA
jgi:hypothetical protein